MRSSGLTAIACVAALAGSLGAAGQASSRIGPLPRAEAIALTELVDGVLAGKPGGGDAWLKFNGHFLRASDGRVYLAFTVTLDEVSTGFDSMAMYVRLVARGTRNPAAAVRVTGSDQGTPVSSPESQFAHGNPTAGEASSRLGLMATELGSAKSKFEGFFVAQRGTAAAPVLRRSLIVAPGDYDIDVVVRERLGGRGQAAPKWAALQQTLTVPDLGGDQPTMSSIILSDRIDVLAKRPSSSQLAERPYAFGSTEVLPDPDATFSQSDVLCLVYFVYNLAVDKGNLPDVTVEYAFRQLSQFGTFFGELAPQHFGRGSTAPAFDAKAGRQLAVTQALPLATFPPDTYEVEITVTDNLSGLAARRLVRFTVI